MRDEWCVIREAVRDFARSREKRGAKVAKAGGESTVELTLKPERNDSRWEAEREWGRRCRPRKPSADLDTVLSLGRFAEPNGAFHPLVP